MDETFYRFLSGFSVSFYSCLGCSVYNPDGLRMDPLSKDSVGVILSFDMYEKLVNISNKTIDEDLEIKKTSRLQVRFVTSKYCK